MANDFSVSFDLPDLDGIELELRSDLRKVWLWAIGRILKDILQDAPDGVPVFTGRTKESFENALNQLVDMGGEFIPLTFSYNPNYSIDFLMRRKDYLESNKGTPEPAELEFDDNIYVPEVTLNVPYEIFQIQNLAGDPTHRRPQRPEPWDLLTQAKENIINELKDRLVEVFQRRVRSRLKIRAKSATF